MKEYIICCQLSFLYYIIFDDLIALHYGIFHMVPTLRITVRCPDIMNSSLFSL